MLECIKKINWGIATILLVGGGLYFTKNLSFIQLKIKTMFSGFKKNKKDEISPFQTLMMALAARIGVGSLAGIALAIYLGGPGTIFWIWVTTILTAPNSFAESALAVKYREKDGKYHKGGPSFYMKKGLGNNTLAKIYAVLVIISYIGGFLTIQANTIATSMNIALHFEPMITGVSLAILSGLIIIKGVKGISNITAKLVPIMGVSYFILSIVVLGRYYTLIPNLLFLIVKDAFTIKSASFGILTTLMIGLERGIFATEAGLGSGAIASGATDEDNPVGQGMIQMLGIYFTTFVICTSTALLILTSKYQTLNLSSINGIEITQYAFHYHLGNLGSNILTLIILFFAFSTVLTGYYYGEACLKFLKPNITEKGINLLKIITVILLVVGSITSADILWNIVDIQVAVMAIINMYILIKLRHEVVSIWNLDKNKNKV